MHNAGDFDKSSDFRFLNKAERIKKPVIVSDDRFYVVIRLLNQRRLCSLRICHPERSV